MVSTSTMGVGALGPGSLKGEGKFVSGSVLDLLGWLGGGLGAVAYVLVSTRRIVADSVLFQGLNMAGATLLCLACLHSGALPSACMNIAWILIGAQSLATASQRRRRAASGHSPSKRQAVREAARETGRGAERHVTELATRSAHDRLRVQASACPTGGSRGGQGRGRTADLPIFSRTLVPTELPGRCLPTTGRLGEQNHTGAIRGLGKRCETGIPLCCPAIRPPSSSGPGPRPFTAVARVRIPLGVPLEHAVDLQERCSS